MREIHGNSSSDARCAKCGATQETGIPAGEGLCIACGAELAAPPAVERGSTVSPRVGTAVTEYSTNNARYREVRLRIASILGNLRPGDVDHTAEPGESTRSARRLSRGAAFVLLPLLALAGWIAVLFADQFAFHRRVAQDAHRLAERIESYRGETGRYPDAATWQRWVSGGDAASFLDPWGRPYSYTVDSRAFSIVTHGADGRPGGGRKDEDLTFVFPYTNPRMALPHAHPKDQAASR